LEKRASAGGQSFFYQQLDALRELRQAVRKDLLAESRKQSATKLLRQVSFDRPDPSRAAHRADPKRLIVSAPSGNCGPTADWRSIRATVRNTVTWGGQLQRSKKPQQVRGLNQNHNHDMKAVFKSAASMASSREGVFHDFYQGLLAKGMKPAMARLTLGAKDCGDHSNRLEERSTFRRKNN